MVVPGPRLHGSLAILSASTAVMSALTMVTDVPYPALGCQVVFAPRLSVKRGNECDDAVSPAYTFPEFQSASFSRLC